MPHNIDLSCLDRVDPDSTHEGFWTDGNVVTERKDGFIVTSKLPRLQRVTMLRLGGGLSRLSIGSYRGTVVTVTGPTGDIERLRNEVL